MGGGFKGGIQGAKIKKRGGLKGGAKQIFSLIIQSQLIALQIKAWMERTDQ